MSAQVTLGYKLTEAGVIPDDWEAVQLENICTLVNGRGFKPHEWESSGLPIIRIQNLNGSDEFNYYSGKYDQKILVESEQLLFAWSGSRGTSFGPHVWRGGKALLNYHTWKVVINESKINARYFFYALKDLTACIEKDAHGASALVHTQKCEMEKYYVRIPPMELQRSIATALSDMDALISGLDQLITKKRDIKQATMQRLLTGQQRLPGFSGKWEVKTLWNLASIQRGASPRPIDSPIWFDDRSLVGWVRISDVTRSNIFLKETTQRLSELGIKHSRPVSSGSLIMSICATVGRPVITEIDTCIHDGFVVFDNLKASKYFMYYALKFIEADWSRHGQTGSQMNLNTGLIKNTEISVPPNEEQIAIASVLSDMDVELSKLEAECQKAHQLKQGMMQELLTGRIRLL